MKARIDTKAKTIAIEETVTVDQLLKFVKALFPQDYKQWKVETNVSFNVTSTPIVIREREVWPYNPQPFWYYSDTTTCSTGSITYTAGDPHAYTISGQASTGPTDAVLFVDYQQA